MLFRKENQDSSAQDQSEVESKKEKLQKRCDKFFEPLKEYKELLELRTTVSKTRINRINAATRLLSTENFLQGINIYYSCFSAIISILSLLSEDRVLSVWSAILTVILAISIVYLNAQKYGSRSQELKNNYIELHKLLFDIGEAEATNNTTCIHELHERYYKLLQTSENHNRIDDLNRKKSYGSLTKSEKIEYYCELVIHKLLHLLLILFPVIGTIILAFRGTLTGLLW